MTRPRRASVIATLALLAGAATASAECAWVLWEIAASTICHRPTAASPRL